MKKIKGLSEISEELVLHRFHNGFKLINPEKINSVSTSNILCNVQELKKINFNLYFLNLDSAILDFNETQAISAGFSVNDLQGKSIYDFSSNIKYADKVVANDKKILISQTTNILEEHEGIGRSFISIKSPWYSAANKITGIFGLSIPTQDPNLIDFLNQTVALGMMVPANIAAYNTQLPGKIINQNYFTERETEVLYHLVRGNTMKSMGRILNLSPRTIEHHLNNIKLKLKVSSKSDVIEKVIDMFFAGKF